MHSSFSVSPSLSVRGARSISGTCIEVTNCHQSCYHWISHHREQLVTYCIHQNFYHMNYLNPLFSFLYFTHLYYFLAPFHYKFCQVSLACMVLQDLRHLWEIVEVSRHASAMEQNQNHLPPTAFGKLHEPFYTTVSPAAIFLLLRWVESSSRINGRNK